MSHSSTANSASRPAPTYQAGRSIWTLCLSIFSAPPILPHRRPFPPKPKDTYRPAVPTSAGIDKVSGQREVGCTLVSQEGS